MLIARLSLNISVFYCSFIVGLKLKLRPSLLWRVKHFSIEKKCWTGLDFVHRELIGSLDWFANYCDFMWVTVWWKEGIIVLPLRQCTPHQSRRRRDVIARGRESKKKFYIKWTCSSEVSIVHCARFVHCAIHHAHTHISICACVKICVLSLCVLYGTKSVAL